MEQLNQKSLSQLTRAIKLSAGVFSLILVRCNYTGLPKKIIRRIKESLISFNIQEISLPDSVTTLYSSIQFALKDNHSPDALMVLGLSAVKAIDEVLSAANQVREEFKKNLSFPVIIWLNDPVFKKFARQAPDLKSWAVPSISFELSNEELLEALNQNAEKIFHKELQDISPHSYSLPDFDTISYFQGASVEDEDPFRRERVLLAELLNPQEFETFLNDLKEREINIDNLDDKVRADLLKANLYLLQGWHAKHKNDVESAIVQYRNCLYFWQKVNDKERQSVLLCYIAECYEKNGNLENAKSYFQQCIEISEQGKNVLFFRANSGLCRILQKLENWSELERAAEKTRKQIRVDHARFLLAQSYKEIKNLFEK